VSKKNKPKEIRIFLSKKTYRKKQNIKKHAYFSLSFQGKGKSWQINEFFHE
jgi:hypothetical protein